MTNQVLGEVSRSGDEFTALSAFRQMAAIRAFEERALELASEGLIQGSIHLCLGQEAIPVGALAALSGADRVTSTYRGHGWALACGVPALELMAELCQRAGGVNGGRGGSPYLSSYRHGFWGENSIVGAGVPISAGLAMAAAAREEGGVVLTSIGDGAMGQGAVHEGLVFAAGRDLPLIVVVENNGWSEMTATSAMIRIEDLVDRAAPYGITGRVVDGDDALAVRDAVAEAAELARAGAGPVLLECKTHRLSGHYNRDIQHYRSKEDRALAADADPIAALRASLVDGGTATADELDEILGQVGQELADIVEAVRGMEEPDPATAHDHLYAAGTASSTTPLAVAEPAGEEMTYIKAVTAALDAELESRPEALVYGEDCGLAGGIFGATRGLQEKYGADRVFDTPIAESAILGSAVGAAMAGMRPIVEIMWADFIFVALDQVINQAANVRYVSRGELSAPLTIRTQQGVTPGSCAQHSQCIEAILAHIPGIRVGLAATPQDAYDMLRAAVADPDPCVVIEARALYQVKGPVEQSAVAGPAAGARLRRAGADAAIITWGTAVPSALQAANALAERGVDCSVLDLRWLSPLDDEAIAQVVERSAGRVAVVHEANLTAGFGAEIASRVQERHFDLLDAPVMRIGTPDVRMPSAPALQRALVPDAESIATAIARLAAGTEW